VGCGCPAIVVPFAEHGETEQLDRAQRLASLGIARSVSVPGIAPGDFAALVLQQRGKSSGVRHRLRTDGSTWTAQWLQEHAESVSFP